MHIPKPSQIKVAPKPPVAPVPEPEPLVQSDRLKEMLSRNPLN